MYLGEQLGRLTDERLTLSAQLGVEHIAAHTTSGSGIAGALAGADGTWNVETLKALRARTATFGIAVDVLALDVEALWWSLLLRTPDRDARLEVARNNIRAAGAAGVPCLKYRFQPLGVLRTGRAPGRGGAEYSSFHIDHWQDDRPTDAGVVSESRMWEVIAELLDAIVPVAEESDVRLAFHPQDPALPPEGVRGIPHVVGTVDALQRFLSINESPVHGLNFCQGTVAEMCADPATEVLAAIRTFGAQGKIFMVHFRNITGGRLHFEEVYPDNGDVDMLRAIQAYKDVGYRGMLCPDHVPRSTADPDGERQFAFCLGYTRALLQAVGA
jgi:mannonate dehydratase